MKGPAGGKTRSADVVSERDGERGAERGAKVLLFPEVGIEEADDATIVRLLTTGDPRAPRIVWQRFSPMVKRMLGRAFGPEHEIDDVVQEVFLVLFERIHTLREPKALRAFIISITAYSIRYEVRRKVAGRWLRFGDSLADEVEVEGASGPDLDSREAVVRLYRILDRLGTDERTAFVLRFIEGMELGDIARALDVSIATTKRRLARAWQRVITWAQRDGALASYIAGLSPERTP